MAGFEEVIVMEWNHYYEVVKPLFYLERKGHAESNTYIGASRVLDAIYEGHQARAGDQFHILVGGNFLVRTDQAVADVGFWFPKHIFEKSYGGSPTAKGLFEDLEKQGVVRRIPAPTTKLDYAASRAEKTFSPSEPRLRYVENSPTAVQLGNYGSTLATIARDNGLTAKFYDFHEERRARLQITRQEPAGSRHVLDVFVSENGRVYINPSKTVFDVPSFIDAVRKLPDVDPDRIYEASFWARSIDILEDEDFLNVIDTHFGHAAGSPIPKP
jgi:hypothetical protein